MVAPVQGSIPKSANDPVTYDYFNEMENYIKTPGNEGKEMEYVAPDGTKIKISDASYLSTVRSNVMTGKFDAKAEENNKAVDKDADTSVGSYEDEKKAKAEKNANNTQDVDPAQNEAKGEQSEGSGKSALSKGESTKDSSTNQLSGIKADAAKADAQIAKTKAETVKIGEETKESFAKMDQNNAKMTKISKEITAKSEQKLQKAVKARAAKAEKANEEADQATEEDSSSQTGSKMGFEGKLMTTAGASSGKGGGNSAASDKAWADTMNGKYDVQAKVIAQELPKLVNVKAEGAKAAQPGLDQAANSDTAAQQSRDNRSAASDNGDTKNLVNGIGIGVAATGIVTGTVGIIAGNVQTGIGMAMNAALPGSGAAVVLKGQVEFWGGVAGVAMGVVGTGIAIAKTVMDVGATRAECRGYDRATEASVKMAETQRTQSMIARKNAVAQANATNVKIIKATQALNKVSQEMSSGSLVSASSMSAVNTDGMNEDQIESVKQDRYNQIMAHEQEHAAIIGGSPVIETDANGVAIGGYVQIDVPSVDESDLEGTIERAQLVVDAALAPADPSSQDQSIASQAKDVLSRAQDMLAEKVEEAEETEKDGEEKVEEPKEEVKEEIKEEAKKAA